MPKHSQLDIKKHKGQVLDEIMAWKRLEVPKQMELVPLAQAKAFALISPPALDFAAALTAKPGASLIAEVKRASPSKGLIAKEWDPVFMAETYVLNGAAAISCLTDARFFQGQLDYLTAIKERFREAKVTVPVLRKEFIYHEYQIYEARMAGADAVLLIVAVLSDTELRTLLQLTHNLKMAALVEVHDEAEVERALAAGAQIIGVNNRDLRTFEVDIETTARLRALIPADKILVGESGIRTVEDVARMAEMGCDAILVGESFCKLPQRERGGTVRKFAMAGRPKL
ncbi:MAG: indole-3-glycerol phosphate synthase TrpC [Caldilineaceae bacterium]|nr:indole-3-glycerol phosphate synthase TrpC [Caldilineaceae bacterium]MBP8108547.1 indole-3-glycerol phosphate synthase TrpC [Caldilineaceae bacterium]MBP8123517.1 indole-3-glycerol phosphate synthase TrpC [Caldilineaceae bacterium]MBP9074826.1 indole-3-glycerol phosphate synthase TrpC [Caldilineaceae bacterium]